MAPTTSLRERERVRLIATRPTLSLACASGRFHGACEDHKCECVCHALVTYGRASRP